MRIQNSFDIAQAHRREGEITVARYVPKAPPSEPQQASLRGSHDTENRIMEFRQGTIGQILDSEKEMVLSAPERYGKYYEIALECSLLMTHFLKSADPDRWVFAAFLSQVKKHHTLALFSAVRLHKVQAMMVLRQALEAGACAAFAIANPARAVR